MFYLKTTCLKWTKGSHESEKMGVQNSCVCLRKGLQIIMITRTECFTEYWIYNRNCVILCHLEWQFDTYIDWVHRCLKCIWIAGRHYSFYQLKVEDGGLVEGTLNPWCDEDLCYIEENCLGCNLSRLSCSIPYSLTSLGFFMTRIFSNSLPIVSSRLTGHHAGYGIGSSPGTVWISGWSISILVGGSSCGGLP